MQHAAAWFARIVGLALVGALTFLGPPTSVHGPATQAIAYAVLCLGTAVWAIAELWRGVPERLGLPLLIGSLAAVTVAGSVGASAGGAGDSLIALAFSAMMSAGSELGLSATIGVGAAGCLGIEVGGLLFGQGLGTLLGLPVLLFSGALVGRYRVAFRVQAEQSAALLAQHERLRAEQRRADVLDERARIAREIHDVLAHSLGALSIQIQAARTFFAELDDPERGLETLATAQRMAADGLIETRRAVFALRTDTLPLNEELARAAAEHAAAHGVSVHCDTEGVPRPVPPDATVALLRTARESLVNAAKHAPSHAIDIRLAYAPDRLRMTITNGLADDVRTSATEPGAVEQPELHTVDGGYGLTGMHERLRLLRGTLDAGVRGQEWIVTAELPLAPTLPTSPTPEGSDR